MVIIREIELFDYIKLHNTKLCKKIYRLELSNIPYIIHRNDLDLIYRMVWNINYKYNILGHEGTIVNRMLNNNYEAIAFYSDKAKMTANNYIDFEMSDDEYDEFISHYENAIKTLYYLTVFETGLIVNRKGVTSILAKVYGISKKYLAYTYEDYEFYIKNDAFEKILMGYAKSELKVQELKSTKKLDDSEELLSRLSSAVYSICFGKHGSYNSYVNSVNEEITEARESEGLFSHQVYDEPPSSINDSSISNRGIVIDSLGLSRDYITIDNSGAINIPTPQAITYIPP